MKKVIVCKGDLTKEDSNYIINSCQYVCVDTETTGLNPLEDKLCLIQIYTGEKAFILKYDDKLEYTNLVSILESKNVMKVFHHANFDIRFLTKHLQSSKIENVICTKVAAKLLNGLKESSSLRYLVKKYLEVDLDKSMQKSNWSKDNLSFEQLDYALNDVIYLYKLWKVLETQLLQNNLFVTARRCFDYLPTNAKLQNQGIDNIFIY